MGQSFFIWKDIDCRSMGVRLASPVPIVRPEERVKHIEIPGRSGDLTELEGDNVYNSYIQTASIMVHNGYRAREVFSWLRGSGYVTFSGEPDRRQEARIIGAITLNKHAYNLDWWTGEVQFYCQPFKELLSPKTTSITSSGSHVFNAGDFVSYPKIIAEASATSMTITVNGGTLTITGLTSGRDYVIDSSALEVEYGNYKWLTKNATGTFPTLAVGDNTVTGSGWSRLVITRRERYL